MLFLRKYGNSGQEIVLLRGGPGAAEKAGATRFFCMIRECLVCHGARDDGQ